MNASASVLVVDDDADVRMLVRELLTRAGYRVTEALDGRAALRALRDTYADRLLEVDFGERRVRAGGQDVELTPLEFRLLSAFVDHPGQLLAHDQLLELA